MTTKTLPKQAGDPIYAAQDGIYIYKDADMNSDKLGNFVTKGDVMFTKDTFIGPWTGEKNGSFYEVTVQFRTKNLWPFNKTITVDGWVLGSQITNNSKEDVAKDEKEREAEDLRKYLEDLTNGSGDDAKKGLTASGNGAGEGMSTNNIIIGSVFVLTAVLIIVGVAKRFKKSPTN